MSTSTATTDLELIHRRLQHVHFGFPSRHLQMAIVGNKLNIVAAESKSLSCEAHGGQVYILSIPNLVDPTSFIREKSFRVDGNDTVIRQLELTIKDVVEQAIATRCPLCRHPVALPFDATELGQLIDCSRCGEYQIDQEFFDAILRNGKDPLESCANARAQVAYSLHQTRRSGLVPRLTRSLFRQVFEHPHRPSLQEQIDNLIRIIGDATGNPGVGFELSTAHGLFRVGCFTEGTYRLILGEAQERQLILVQRGVALTFRGWDHYEQILRSGSKSARVFMAMPFNRTDLDTVWLPVVSKAVQDTGFLLQRTLDEPRPGIIDVRMRQMIKDARFVIVELTHANHGAYWEAGYAEGLGKPVIYTCHKDEKNIHFDTAHLTRIVWDENNLQLAADQLKAMIRLSIPEAKAE